MGRLKPNQRLQQYLDGQTPDPAAGLTGIVGGAIGGVPGQVAGDTAEAAAEPLGRGLGDYASSVLANLNPYGAKVADPSASQITQYLDAKDLGTTAALSATGAHASPAQIVFHGSPHDFDSFSAQHIGTGEGHQSYGHGLYFSEEPKVAETYQRQTSAGNFPDVADPTGRPLSREEALAAYFRPGNKVPGYAGTDEVLAFNPNGGSWNATVRGTQPDPGSTSARVRMHSTTPRDADLQSVLGPQGYKITKGRAYAADVPENDNLLHYDKPLSQQPPGVMEKLKAADLLRNLEQGGRGGPVQDVLGETLYRSLGENDQAASMLLSNAGIPGMRYLDQRSRGTGDGTHNYVIWDDSKIKPVAKGGSIDEVLARLAALK